MRYLTILLFCSSTAFAQSNLGRNNTLTTPTMTAIQSNCYALEHFRYEEGDSNVVAEHYKVIGGDHHWFNFSVNGKDANLLLWEFFDQFDIYGTR